MDGLIPIIRTKRANAIEEVKTLQKKAELQQNCEKVYLEVLEYKDIGFRDEGRAHRKVGANANIILFSEKLGHQDFLSDIANKYNISILSLGGQPSVLTSEYFV